MMIIEEPKVTKNSPRKITSNSDYSATHNKDDDDNHITESSAEDRKKDEGINKDNHDSGMELEEDIETLEFNPDNNLAEELFYKCIRSWFKAKQGKIYLHKGEFLAIIDKFKKRINADIDAYVQLASEPETWDNYGNHINQRCEVLIQAAGIQNEVQLINSEDFTAAHLANRTINFVNQEFLEKEMNRLNTKKANLQRPQLLQKAFDSASQIKVGIQKNPFLYTPFKKPGDDRMILENDEDNDRISMFAPSMSLNPNEFYIEPFNDNIQINTKKNVSEETLQKFKKPKNMKITKILGVIRWATRGCTKPKQDKMVMWSESKTVLLAVTEGVNENNEEKYYMGPIMDTLKYITSRMEINPQQILKEIQDSFVKEGTNQLCKNYETTSWKYFPAKKAWENWTANTSKWMTIKGFLSKEGIDNEFSGQTVSTIRREIQSFKPIEKGNIINFRREDQNLKKIMEEA